MLLDNGRSNMLGTEFQDMLRCIRCGACMNHCPVYQAVGGHAYGWVYPGPMGAVLTPSLIGVEKGGQLPNASTFCGRCEAVCPMRIPLPKMMRHWREREFEKKLTPGTVRAGLGVWGWFVPAACALPAGGAARQRRAALASAASGDGSPRCRSPRAGPGSATCRRRGAHLHGPVEGQAVSARDRILQRVRARRQAAPATGAAAVAAPGSRRRAAGRCRGRRQPRAAAAGAVHAEAGGGGGHRGAGLEPRRAAEGGGARAAQAQPAGGDPDGRRPDLRRPRLGHARGRRGVSGGSRSPPP